MGWWCSDTATLLLSPPPLSFFFFLPSRCAENEFERMRRRGPRLRERAAHSKALSSLPFFFEWSVETRSNRPIRKSWKMKDLAPPFFSLPSSPPLFSFLFSLLFLLFSSAAARWRSEGPRKRGKIEVLAAFVGSPASPPFSFPSSFFPTRAMADERIHTKQRGRHEIEN